ncbi:NAD(P)/FAD-dependent oxidoreductase [Methanobacterium petrolearium]|uniref:NAD(P)/FAD-dependent oxidoreductase n=1 Tax=Methanobacterium petrolearium TaxID=710190 RepID=UPI001AEAEFE4|nr:NAD(P)/FAD-dependent oxidoreductase [Methanobacterium petrolearium]MBP1945569.1 NAD(P)H-nitrite reductase large subunit [Methanobacterium petrolearium]BDZ71787.1 NAD(P)/FAD-dependent oxidoreductase [Methanobacterium petrolearium]
MGVKNENIPDKGAAVEKGLETYTIIPYIPGGILDPAILRKIADVAEKYQIECIKMTSEHKIGFYGVKKEDIDEIFHDLGMEPGGHIGKCVRGVKFCTGNTFCKKGYQNTVEMGFRIDETFHRTKTPTKVKISLSGCTRCCAESAVRDIGLIGTPKGWKLLVGGTCGLQVRQGKVLAKNLSDDQVIDCIGKVIEYYVESGTEKRLGRFIEKIGFDKFSGEVLGE